MIGTPNHSPDGLTYDDITAMHRDVTAELRREGHLPWPRRHRRRSAASLPRDAVRTQTTHSPRRRAARRGQRRGDHR
jgi:hypothetical protein